AVVRAVNIPVLGGFGGGPWLDGRIRMAHAAIGYAERWINSKTDTYANVAKITLDALSALIADVRAGRQIKDDQPTSARVAGANSSSGATPLVMMPCVSAWRMSSLSTLRLGATP